MTPLPDLSAIQRILPHRFPFLLVDRIIEFEPGLRIVGAKLVSRGEGHLSRPDHDGTSVMPPTLMMEAVAQVGAVLVLSMPENLDKLVFLLGIDRARIRQVARAGDEMVIEATVLRMRASMGRMAGVVRVNGRMIATGTMTFALGARPQS